MEKAYLITQNTDLSKSFNDYERIYIGDQYCEHNMFFFFNDKVFIEKILMLNKKITITTPIISENGINNFFVFLDNFINKSINKNIDLEIVVNEYGILNKLLNYYPNIKIIWGNFLSGQNKDPNLKIFKDKEEHKNISIDSNYYNNLFNSKKIKRIELYNTFQGIKISQNYELNLYYPYVIYSINRYCVTALINQNKDFLEIVEDCEGCKNIEKNDLDMELKIGNSLEKQFFRGNKQFYLNDKQIENEKIKRIIYNYDLL